MQAVSNIKKILKYQKKKYIVLNVNTQEKNLKYGKLQLI